VKYTRTYQSYAKPQRAGKQKIAHKHMFVSKMDRKRHRKSLEKDNGFDGWDVGFPKDTEDFEDFQNFDNFPRNNSNSDNIHEYQHQNGFSDSGDDYSIDEDCEEDNYSDEFD
jgi:hypothetical protein